VIRYWFLLILRHLLIHFLLGDIDLMTYWRAQE